MGNSDCVNLNVYLTLLNELEVYEKKGVRLAMENKMSSPENIAKECVICESGSYMRDYVFDEDGKMRLLNFNKIIF